MRDRRALRGLYIFGIAAQVGACATANLPSAQLHLPVSPPEFQIRLPPGSWLQREQGIDTDVWTIRNPHAPAVHYDGGLMTLTPRIFKPVDTWIRECEWDEDDEVSPPTRSNPDGIASCSLEKDDESHRFTVHVRFPDGASFYAVELKSKSQVREILSTVLTYSPGSFDRGLFIDAATLRKRIQRGWDVKRDGPLLMESAISWDAADVVALLAQSGVDAQGGPDGQTYLTLAIEADRPACVRALIAAGARLDAGRQLDRNAAVAAAGQSLELVQIVVAQGLSVNTSKGPGTGFAVGATMLMAASESEHIDIVRWLLDQGALIDDRDPDGRTALMTAAGAGSPDIVALLLSRNADRDLRNRAGQTAALIAEAEANYWQGELDALRQPGMAVGPDDLAYFEGRIANWRAIAALLADTAGFQSLVPSREAIVRGIAQREISAAIDAEQTGDRTLIPIILAELEKTFYGTPRNVPFVTAARHAIGVLADRRQLQVIWCEAIKDDLNPTAARLGHMGGWFGIRGLQELLKPERDKNFDRALKRYADRYHSDITFIGPRDLALIALPDTVSNPPVTLNEVGGGATNALLANRWNDWIATHREELEKLAPTGEGVDFSERACKGGKPVKR